MGSQMARQAQPSRCDNERGAAVVEFALVLPQLMMLVFGVVQFSMLYNRQQALHASAREGARIGALPSTTLSDIDARVASSLDGIPMSGTPTVTVTPNVNRPCEGRIGETVIVEVTVPTTIEIPVWGTETRTLVGRGQFRCE